MFRHFEVGEDIDDLGLLLPALFVDLVQPQVGVLDALLQFCVVLFHLHQHLDAPRVLQHLHSLQVFEEGPLSSEQPD